MKATDSIEEEEEGGSKFTPKHQGEADECDLIPEEDHETQESHRGQDEGDEEEAGTNGPLAPRVGVLTHLGYHEELQAKNGGHHSHGTHTPSHTHTHSQSRHLGLAQVSEAVWLALVGEGAEVPQPKEAVLIQEPIPITDGDRREDHSQSTAHDDEGLDEGLKEGPAGPSLAQQPLGLEDTKGSNVSEGPAHKLLKLSKEESKHAFYLPKALFFAWVSQEVWNPPKSLSFYSTDSLSLGALHFLFSF